MAQQNVSGGTIVMAMVILAGVIWWNTRDSASGAGQGDQTPVAAAAPTPLPSIVSENQPLDYAALAARIKTIRGVLDVKAPSVDDNQKFIVHVSADSTFGGADTTEDVLHTIHNHIGNVTYTGANVLFTFNLVNQYGEKSSANLFALNFTPEDIHRMVFDNITTFDVLNLGQYNNLSSATQRIVGEDCVEGSDLAKFAQAFCGRVLSSP